MTNKYIVFDLDDTLMYEIDYLKSAYRDIALKLNSSNLYEIMYQKYLQKENVFEFLSTQYQVDVTDLLKQYREHFPEVKLIHGAKQLLDFCKMNNFKLGLVSDGRSLTQRNKLKALKIDNLFDKIIISDEFGSEKPNQNNFLSFINEEILEYYYIGDNYNKDFVTPNRLGWITIALKDSGKNIHKQNLEISNEYRPHYVVNSLEEIINIIKNK